VHEMQPSGSPPQFAPPQGSPQPWQSGPSPWHPPPQWGASPSPASDDRRSTAALVLSIVALVVALLTAFGALVVFLSGYGYAYGGFSDDFGDSHLLRGTAPIVIAGQPYEGSRLADEVTRVFENSFSTVEELTCPDTPRVDADVVTECTGVVDDWDTTVTITFEDDEGHFTLEEEY
jgi:hypothetical protein